MGVLLLEVSGHHQQISWFMVLIVDDFFRYFVSYSEETSSTDGYRGYTTVAQSSFVITMSTNVVSPIQVLVDEYPVELCSEMTIDSSHDPSEEGWKRLGADDITRVTIAFTLIREEADIPMLLTFSTSNHDRRLLFQLERVETFQSDIRGKIGIDLQGRGLGLHLLVPFDGTGGDVF